MNYACPTWEYVVDAHLLKLQSLQDIVLRAIGNLDGRTLTGEMHMTFIIPCVYDYINKLRRTQAEVILNIEIQTQVVLDKEKPCIGSIRGLNLPAVKLTTV
jgi:hypothetical protein